jgi:type I restriction enzyme S subunit
MSDSAELISERLDIWTAATERRASPGRSGGKRISLYGIERLRALILDLAVRGKLVPQNANEEPASELLKRVAEIRSTHQVQRKARGGTDGNPNQWERPAGWEIVRLSDLANPQAGFAFKSRNFNEQGEGLPLVRIRDVGQPFTGTYYSGEYREEFVVSAGDYLISMDGEFRVAIWLGPKALLNQRVSRLQFYSDEVVQPFVAMALQAELAKEQGVKAYTTVDHLSGKQIADAVIRLPPLAEQQRIVAKVAELMALCDALEEESTAAMTAHQMLVRTLLATLVHSADAAELADNWMRLAASFDALFSTGTSVDALKQTILELAVRGKLVPPKEGDASAATLLQQWRDAKKRALQQSGDHRIKVAASPVEPPFPIPTHWDIESFENIFLFVDYRGNTPPKTIFGIPLITAKNVRMGRLDREPREFISEKTYQSWMTRGFPAIGDLFFTTEAPLGNVCVNNIDEPFAIAQRLICLKPYGKTNTRFFALAIMSASMQLVIDSGATGMTARGIKAAKLKPIPLPVPPEAEQARIVAKVDALMALCDDMKACIADAAQTQMRLADAVVAGA